MLPPPSPVLTLIAARWTARDVARSAALSLSEHVVFQSGLDEGERRCRGVLPQGETRDRRDVRHTPFFSSKTRKNKQPLTGDPTRPAATKRAKQKKKNKEPQLGDERFGRLNRSGRNRSEPKGGRWQRDVGDSRRGVACLQTTRPACDTESRSQQTIYARFPNWPISVVRGACLLGGASPSLMLSAVSTTPIRLSRHTGRTEAGGRC